MSKFSQHRKHIARCASRIGLIYRISLPACSIFRKIYKKLSESGYIIFVICHIILLHLSAIECFQIYNQLPTPAVPFPRKRSIVMIGILRRLKTSTFTVPVHKITPATLLLRHISRYSFSISCIYIFPKLQLWKAALQLKLLYIVYT